MAKLSYFEAINKINEYTEKTPMTVLSISRPNGYTIAHEMVLRGIKFPDNHKALKLKDNRSQSVALFMVTAGHTFSVDSPYHQLTTDTGWTVAHEQASRGYIFPDNHEALEYVTIDGKTVRDVQNDYLQTQNVETPSVVESPDETPAETEEAVTWTVTLQTTDADALRQALKALPDTKLMKIVEGDVEATDTEYRDIVNDMYALIQRTQQCMQNK